MTAERLHTLQPQTRAIIDQVPAASNVEYYAGIVEEHALRRRLLRVGGDLGTYATAMDEPISQVLDRSEQAVFGVSERRIGDGLAPIDPLLGPAIEKAEELNRLGAEVTGVPTGFRDLDRKLAGLHPMNLLIIAAFGINALLLFVPWQGERGSEAK